MTFRAQGKPKPSFGPEVKELHSLRDHTVNPEAAEVFRHVPDSAIHEGVKRIAAIPEHVIHQTVKDAGLHPSLAHVLLARKSYLQDAMKTPEFQKSRPGPTHPQWMSFNTRDVLGQHGYTLNPAHREGVYGHSQGHVIETRPNQTWTYRPAGGGKAITGQGNSALSDQIRAAHPIQKALPSWMVPPSGKKPLPGWVSEEMGRRAAAVAPTPSSGKTACPHCGMVMGEKRSSGALTTPALRLQAHIAKRHPKAPRGVGVPVASSLAKSFGGAPRMHPMARLHTDPPRFQYKEAGVKTTHGQSGTFKTQQRYDPKKDTRGLLVWHDKAQKKTFVVNGHNRYHQAKAQGLTHIKVRHLRAKSAEHAKVLGALDNLIRERGTAEDAAKIFHQHGLGHRHLRAAGINTRAPVVAQGLKLAAGMRKSFQEVDQILEKVRIRTYQRQTAAGGQTTVHEHSDIRGPAHPSIPQPRSPASAMPSPSATTQAGKLPSGGTTVRPGVPAPAGRKEPTQSAWPAKPAAGAPKAPRTPATPPETAITPQLQKMLDDLEKDPVVIEGREYIKTLTSTQSQHQDEEGIYKPEVQESHARMADDPEIINPNSEVQPGEKPTCVMLIGQPGSGKTTIKKTVVPLAGERFTDLNADTVKMKMDGWDPMKAAAFHHESADILENNLVPLAAKRRLHTIIDWVGKSPQKVLDTLAEFKGMGYETHVYHTKVPLETSVSRAMKRARKKKNPDGSQHPDARFVDPKYIVHDVDHKPDHVFELLKGRPDLVDQGASYDNSGSAPVVIHAFDNRRRKGGTGSLVGKGATDGRSEEAQEASMVETRQALPFAVQATPQGGPLRKGSPGEGLHRRGGHHGVRDLAGIAARSGGAPGHRPDRAGLVVVRVLRTSHGRLTASLFPPP